MESTNNLSNNIQNIITCNDKQLLKLTDGQTFIMNRSKAIKYYKLTKFMAKEFSKDESTKVGALFMYPGTLQILSMGYNGMPRGVNELKEVRWQRPLKYRFVEHAERNAIYNAAQSGISLKDAICVVTMFPCADCARGIIQSGCKMVISLNLNECYDNEKFVRWMPDWEISLEMFKEADVKLMFLTKTEVLN